MAPLMTVNGLVKHFPVKHGLLRRTTGTLRAVDDVSFTVESGETLGVVGESGCGKTTLARTVLRLIDADAGRVHFADEDDSPGLRRGGVLNIVRHALELVCDAAEIPDAVVISLEGFGVGQAVQISQ